VHLILTWELIVWKAKNFLTYQWNSTGPCTVSSNNIKQWLCCTQKVNGNSCHLYSCMYTLHITVCDVIYLCNFLLDQVKGASDTIIKFFLCPPRSWATPDQSALPFSWNLKCMVAYWDLGDGSSFWAIEV